MSNVTLEKVKKSFGPIDVIHGVDLKIGLGEFCVFVGPSGCGKSTLLRMVAGLEKTTNGTISIGSRDVTQVDAAKRGVAMVFQSYALYPHMTVKENMSFGLKMSGQPQEKIDEKVAAASTILKLDDYLDRKPKALSGGQRQRVAIGRSIVREPDVFLFDEPLSNLDAELRVQMRLEIAKLHNDLNATMIYVTHDQVEAMTLADKIVVLRAGRVEQYGAPMDLYNDPDNKFVGSFIGSPKMNFLEAVVKQHVHAQAVVELVAFDNASIPLTFTEHTPEVGSRLDLGIRPEHFTADGTVKLQVSVDAIENLGGTSYAYANTQAENALTIEVRGQSAASRGESLKTGFNATDVLAFDAQSGIRLR